MIAPELMYLSISITVLPPPVVSVLREGSNAAGTSYILICIVSIPGRVEFSQPPSIQWLGLDTPPPSPLMQNDRIYISTLTVALNPASTVYTCIASYTLNGVSSLTVNDSISISVISELMHYIRIALF